jgi:PAS domain S-box-containing protein
MSTSPTVLRVGDAPLESATGVDLLSVRSPEDVTGEERPDCVVCHHDAGVDSVAAVSRRWPGVPVLYCDDESDGTAAAAATRMGATEYVVLSELEGTLADRVRAVVGTGRAAPERAERRRRDRVALRRFNEAVSDPDAGFEATLERLLTVGCEYFELGLGFLTDVGEDELLVTHAHAPAGELAAGETFGLEGTYCKRTVEDERAGPLSIHDAAAAGWADDPAYDGSGLRCYLGERVLVDGDVRGTLCFADTSPRAEPFRESELTFVELLAGWVAAELTRRRREAELRRARDRANRTLERIDDGFFALDDAWRIAFMNEAVIDSLSPVFAPDIDPEVDPTELVGRDFWSVVPSVVDTVFYDAYHRAMETQEPVELEEHVEPLGAWFSVRAYPSKSGLSVYFENVTERKRREKALDGLLGAARSLMVAASKEEVAAVATDAAEDILGYPATAARLYDEETAMLHPTAVSERTRELMGSREPYPPGKGITGEAFERGDPWYVEDGSTLGKGPAFEDLGAVFAHPLGEHGVLTVGTTGSGAIDETDRALVGVLAATAEAALDRADREASLRRYRAVYEHTSEMLLVVDPDGTVALATDSLAERLDERPETLAGADLGRLFTFDEDERERVFEAVLDAPTGRTHVFETWLRTAEGDTPVEVELSWLPTDGPGLPSLLWVVRDITELERTRTELETERERFSQLFERSPDPIVDVEFVDGVPRVHAVNEAFETTFGHDVEEVVGRDLNELVVPDGVADEAVRIDGTAETGRQVKEEVRRLTDRGDRDFLFRGIPYGVGGRGVRAFGIYTDITDRKRRERRLEVFDRVLRHNLRNEATTILGFTDDLRNELTGEYADWADSANRAARSLVESSEDIRTIQRALAGDGDTGVGTGTGTGGRGDLHELVGCVVSDAREEYPDAEFRADVPAGCVVPDSGHLSVVLSELVGNAVIHSDRERPSVEVTASVDRSRPRPSVTLRVTDDGPGIPERERAVLTDEREISQLNHSRGLGLWLTRWVAESIGGRFAFEEPEKRGATVVLELPLAGEDGRAN